MRFITGLLLTMLGLTTLPWTAGAEPVATVRRLAGEARADNIPLAAGTTIQSGATLTTAADARLEVDFHDGARLVLGERARLTVDRYVYDAAAQSGEARLNSQSGPFLITTGAIAKLPGRPLSLATPVAVIGVRGTRFWGGTLDNALDVLVLDGAVSVSNDAGRVELVAGQGTGITAADRAPGAALTWPDAKVRRALDSVDFR